MIIENAGILEAGSIVFVWMYNQYIRSVDITQICIYCSAVLYMNRKMTKKFKGVGI